MSPDPIPLRSTSTLECRSCGAGAPVDEHFCPQCNRILALHRYGDYFSFLGVPRRLTLDGSDLERRFRDLSRKFHPDYFYNAVPAERLASLERSSYLNDAYRTLRNPVSRLEHLLAIEGLPPTRHEDTAVKVPPALLEEVFALNEELDEIRELRESRGADAAALAARLAAARKPIERKRDEHERQLQELSEKWDAQQDAAPDARRATLEALRERLLERTYINNLLAGIEREAQSLMPTQSPEPKAESPEPRAESREAKAQSPTS
jgi:molecular chaperone HscB